MNKDVRKDVRIVVLTAGHVVMGEYAELPDRIRLTNASVIRLWGTQHGLGQIALQGPTPTTILDPVGTVEAVFAAVIMTIQCTY